MPIYEYRCEECLHESSIRFNSFAQAETAVAGCAACGSGRMTRLVSRGVVARGGTRPAPQVAAGAPGTGGSGTDPHTLARDMGAAARGRDMGHDFHEVAARLEKGERAASVESSLRSRVGETMGGH